MYGTEFDISEEVMDKVLCSLHVPLICSSLTHGTSFSPRPKYLHPKDSVLIHPKDSVLIPSNELRSLPSRDSVSPIQWTPLSLYGTLFHRYPRIMRLRLARPRLNALGRTLHWLRIQSLSVQLWKRRLSWKRKVFRAR